MQEVTVTLGAFPATFCPSNPQEFISYMNRVATGVVNDTGQRVAIEFGFVVPPFCPETPDEFMQGLNSVSRGYVEETNASVYVNFGTPSAFCWNDPQGLLAQLQDTVVAYVK
jgi:hypothetical protein